MPIVGEGDKEPNDTYVEQLVASAKAAVDKVVELGVADRDRIGVGGHSYGAFMTANLLAHTDIFRAGIARSGAYNRTLTPFGFQQEERPYWEASAIYNRMSPVHVRGQHQDADPADPRHERRQQRHLPDPVRAYVRRAQGQRRNRALRAAAQAKRTATSAAKASGIRWPKWCRG